MLRRAGYRGSIAGMTATDTPTEPTTHPTVAVLGTGVMGAGMVRSLRRAGLPVRAVREPEEHEHP